MRTLTVAAILSLALPAQAHSEAELEAWLDQWEVAGELDWPLGTDWAFFDLNAHQTAALEDMVERHPCSRILGTWTDEAYKPKPPPPSPAPVPRSSGSSRAPSVDRGMGSNVEQWRSLVSVYFTEVEMALCVMDHESGGNPNAVSPTDDHGLMQINAPTWAAHFGVTRAQLKDPETNLSIAAAIRAQMGWGAWSAVKRGRC